MFHIVLVSPEIPPNTGNVIRLAANTGCNLHLVRPMGFGLNHAKMKRAGLDYCEWERIQIHDSLQQALNLIGAAPQRCFAITTKGKLWSTHSFKQGDVFVFGSETAGLSEENMALFDPDCCARLPMMPNQRSLNLSNAVAITVFEAWRQIGYKGGL